VAAVSMISRGPFTASLSCENIVNKLVTEDWK